MIRERSSCSENQWLSLLFCIFTWVWILTLQLSQRQSKLVWHNQIFSIIMIRFFHTGLSTSASCDGSIPVCVNVNKAGKDPVYIQQRNWVRYHTGRKTRSLLALIKRDFINESIYLFTVALKLSYYFCLLSQLINRPDHPFSHWELNLPPLLSDLISLLTLTLIPYQECSLVSMTGIPYLQAKCHLMQNISFIYISYLLFSTYGQW